MKSKMIALATACVFASSMSFAQTATTPESPAATTAQPPAEAPNQVTPNATNSMAPVEGKNSFTEAQAKERIEKDGFSDVMGLKLDDKGIWQGSAKKTGADVTVKLDYQGNITTE